jgi:hypothetical protein
MEEIMPKVKYTTSRGLHQVAGKGISLNHLDFLAGNTANLTENGLAILEAQARLAEATPTAANILSVTLSGSAVNTCAYAGATAAASVYLPAANADTHLALRFAMSNFSATNPLNIVTTGSATEVTRGNSAVYAKQVIGPLFNNLPESIVTNGTDAAPTANKLTFTPATSNDFIGQNSVIHFYCQKEGQWLVKVFNIAQGTGAVGAFTATVGD